MITDTTASSGWHWIGRYVAVILVVLALGSVIGAMDLFTTTLVFSGKLTAALIVRFLSYGTALGAFWMLGQRSTMALQQHGGRWSVLQHLVLPVVTLIVVSSAYSVILMILKRVLEPTLINIYNWTFIVAILACAVWVVMAVLGQSDTLTKAFTTATEGFGASNKGKLCKACDANNETAARFCMKCGNGLDQHIESERLIAA